MQKSEILELIKDAMRAKDKPRLSILRQVNEEFKKIEVDERRGRKSRQSYQYVDVLTGTVELFDPESGEHLFTPMGDQGEEMKETPRPAILN